MVGMEIVLVVYQKRHINGNKKVNISDIVFSYWFFVEQIYSAD